MKNKPTQLIQQANEWWRLYFPQIDDNVEMEQEIVQHNGAMPINKAGTITGIQ